jgi:hypothetical protein
VVVLDVSATIVVAHSEKENASATFTKTFGFHPLGVWCDNTTDFLAGMLRTGKAGSNTAADHMEVLGQAIAQVPAAQRKHLLIRSDGAGASHDLVDWLTALPRTGWQKYWWPSARRPTTWAAPSPCGTPPWGPHGYPRRRSHRQHGRTMTAGWVAVAGRLRRRFTNTAVDEAPAAT